MLAKLADSGLNGAEAKALEYRALTAIQTVEFNPMAPPVASIHIPYHDSRGKPTGFYRLRFLEDSRSSFDKLTNKKVKRYDQPKGTINDVYLPRLPNLEWQKIFKDPTVPIVITEGEFKAACAGKFGIPTIGLGGVWCFKSNRNALPLLPVFHEVEWHSRKVYVSYDSDTVTNPDVVGALVALCRELSMLGALPFIATIPVIEEGKKAGLDDFLMAKTTKAYAALLKKAEPFAPTAELYRLNSEVAYVRNPGLVIKLEEGLKMTPGSFKEHAYANRYYYETKQTEEGPKLVKKPVAPAWLGWEQRMELSRLTYKPGEDTITDEREYNAWPGWGCGEPKKGSVKPWKELLAYLFEYGEPEAMKWFEQWCAYPIQHPGTKMFSAAVIWGVVHGTGKTLVGHTLMKIYGANATQIADNNLTESHNEWAENKQFVVGDDVMPADTRKAMSDRLKSMITQKELRLNPKYIPSYVVPDCINYYFTANHPDAFFLEDTDRRYFIHKVDSLPKPREWYRTYDKWITSDDGVRALFHHLLHLDLTGFDPQGAALNTRAKAEMTDDSMSDLGVWVRRLRDYPDETLTFGDAPLLGDLWTPKDLLMLYDPEKRGRVTTNGLGRELKRAGVPYFHQGVMLRTRLGAQRAYVVRNAGHWRQVKGVAEAEKHYKETRDGFSPEAEKKEGKY